MAFQVSRCTLLARGHDAGARQAASGGYARVLFLGLADGKRVHERNFRGIGRPHLTTIITFTFTITITITITIITITIRIITITIGRPHLTTPSGAVPCRA